MNFFSVTCFTLLFGLAYARQPSMPERFISDLNTACETNDIATIQTLLAEYVVTPLSPRWLSSGTWAPIDVELIRNCVKERNLEFQNTLLNGIDSDKRADAAFKLGFYDAFKSSPGKDTVLTLCGKMNTEKSLAIKTGNMAMLKALSLIYPAPFTMTDLFNAVHLRDEEMVKFILSVSPTIQQIISKLGTGIYTSTVQFLFSLSHSFFFFNGVLQIDPMDKLLSDIKFLIESDVDIDAKNQALQKSVSEGRLDFVKYLVERDANIHAQNDIALKIAENSGHSDIKNYLCQMYANIHAEKISI